MSVNSKMTAIANGIRTMLGISNVMGLDAMKTNIDTAQTEVNTQNGLIEHISSVLATKAAGIVPTGQKKITENGEHDVTSYATAYVEVPPSTVVKFAEGYFSPEHDEYGRSETVFVNTDFTPDVIAFTLMDRFYEEGATACVYCVEGTLNRVTTAKISNGTPYGTVEFTVDLEDNGFHVTAYSLSGNITVLHDIHYTAVKFT